MKYIILMYFFFAVAFASNEDLLKFNSLHGGVVEQTSSAIFELVKKEDNTFLYITGHDKKNLVSQKLSISAVAKINGQYYPLDLTYEDDHYSLTPYASLKNETNFTVNFTISFPFPGKTESASFNVRK